MSAIGQAVKNGRWYIGMPYGWWGGGELEAAAPEYMADGWDRNWVLTQTINCSGYMNVIREDTLGVGVPKGGTPFYADFVSPWEYFVPNKPYAVGTLLLEPFIPGVSEGHVAMVSTPDQYILQSDSYAGVNESKTVMQQHYYTPWTWAGLMPDLLPVEALPKDTGGPTTKVYPGDTADPDKVARWMAKVAVEDYGLPAILPVMCSYVELTSAWTGPGDVKSIPGYLNNVDYDSYGYFQQRPSMGWGSWAQVTDADYALRKFCSVAAELKDDEWNANTTDADALGRWCQAVQRSGVPDAYRDKGYPGALPLIAGWDSTGGGVVVPDTPSTEPYPYGWVGLEEGTGALKAVDAPPGSWFEPVKNSDGNIYLIMHTDPAWRHATTRPVTVDFRPKGDGFEVREPDGDVLEVSRADFDKTFEIVEEK